MLPVLVVLSERLAGIFKPEGPAAAISISSPDSKVPFLPDYYDQVLRVQFDDVDTASPPMSATALSPKQTQQIAAFVKGLKDSPATTLMIHCYYGAGRSAGVALGIADALAYPEKYIKAMEEQFPVHNKGVRSLVRAAFLS